MDSKKTQPLFEKAVSEIGNILDQGHVEDKVYMDIVMKAFLGHIKIKNTEARENMLKFAVHRSTQESLDGLKKTLKKALPEYI